MRLPEEVIVVLSRLSTKNNCFCQLAAVMADWTVSRETAPCSYAVAVGLRDMREDMIKWSLTSKSSLVADPNRDTAHAIRLYSGQKDLSSAN